MAQFLIILIFVLNSELIYKSFISFIGCAIVRAWWIDKMATPL